jgi:hypothetical protein
VRDRPGDPAALRSLVEVTEGEEEVLGLLPEVRLACVHLGSCVYAWVWVGGTGLAGWKWVG